MENTDRYKNVFLKVFKLPSDKFDVNFDAGKFREWDSISHLALVTAIEDEFNIMLETEDLLNFKSYDLGKEILLRYSIVVD